MGLYEPPWNFNVGFSFFSKLPLIFSSLLPGLPFRGRFVSKRQMFFVAKKNVYIDTNSFSVEYDQLILGVFNTSNNGCSYIFTIILSMSNVGHIQH